VTCIDVFDLISSTAATVFNKLTYLLTLSLSLYCSVSPQIHCNPSSLKTFAILCYWTSTSSCRNVQTIAKSHLVQLKSVLYYDLVLHLLSSENNTNIYVSNGNIEQFW